MLLVEEAFPPQNGDDAVYYTIQKKDSRYSAAEACRIYEEAVGWNHLQVADLVTRRALASQMAFGTVSSEQLESYKSSIALTALRHYSAEYQEEYARLHPNLKNL